MDNTTLINYYVDTLIIQYSTDKIRSHMGAVLKPLVIFELIQSVKNGYNVEDAIGIQLDWLGKIIGITRNLTDGTSTITLTDTDFRNYLKFKIIKNFSNHSLKSIATMLYDFFGMQARVIDNFDMSANYIIYNDLTLAKILKYENLFPKPMGVKINIISSPPSTGLPFIFLHNRHSGKGWGIAGKPETHFYFSDGSEELFSDGTAHDSTNAGNTPANDGTGGQWAIQL